tara:strand:+ start:63562 stop:66453 length:2892 start_codon:yes stop_codon:yes gene_type:complete
MSRLIFEGDTTERFGDIFPKPFIEEIRVFDNLIETDVGLYFETEEGKDAVTFLEETGLSSLKINLQFEPEERFNQYLDGNRPLSTLLGEAISSRTGTPAPSFFEQPPTLGDDGFADHAFFYNSEGKKFIKFYMTIQSDSATEGQLAAGPLYLTCMTFFGSVSQIINNPEQYKEQYSDIAYEKVYNADGTLNVERQEVYLEADGNYYSKIPLMSLDRNYRKTNIINSQQVASRIQSVIQPFVGSIEDADLISSTIQEHQNKPKFLVALQRRVNRFENKTATTVGGSLYGQLVDEISAINNILLGSDILQKRLQFNKIKDRRTERALVANESDITAANTEGLAILSSIDHLFFPLIPLMYRNLETNVPAKDFAFPEEAYIANKAYLFFDYEKALNYKSNISEIFNPYNILELYGKNSLNKLFPVHTARCLLSSTSGQTELRFYDNYYYRTNQEEFGSYEFDHRSLDGNAVYLPSYSYLFNGADRYTFLEKFVERAFDTGDTLGDYRLRCYELDYLKQYSYVNDFETLALNIDISDKTMSFYETEIRAPFQILNEQLSRYLSFAEEFCSYNNLDGRFNDFFLSALENEFSEPYPWDRSPLVYYSVFALIYASWNFDGDTPTTRRTDGTPVDLEGIKDATLVKMKEISPDAGDLESLRGFVNNFNNLYENFLGYNGFLNNTLSLYDLTGDPAVVPEIVKSNDSITISSAPFVVNTVLIDTDLSVVNPSTDDQDFYELTAFRGPRLNRSSAKDYGEIEQMIKNFPLLSDYKVTFKVNEIYRGVTTNIRDEREKSFVDFYVENITGDHVGDIAPGPDQVQSMADQLEELIFPLFIDFYQTLYDLIPAELREYDDGRTQSNDNTDTDGITPEEQWAAMWSTIENTGDTIEREMCNRRQYDKMGRRTDQDAENNMRPVTNRIFFNVLPKTLKEYFGALLYNYYIYSYYIDRRGISLKDFMNLILPNENKVS